MGGQPERRRFIPFRRADILTMLRQDGQLEAAQQPRLEELVRLISAIYHFTFHDKLEALKAAYFPFDPDTDVQPLAQPDEAELTRCAELLSTQLREVLDHANFEPVSEADIVVCLEEDSPFSLKLHIDFEDFEQCAVFTRGESIKVGEIRRWFFWKEEVEVPTYERVALFIRFKQPDHFDPKRRKRLHFDPGSTIVKLFKDIPKADLEMLFPNTEVRMTGRDKALMGIPAIGGALPILWMKVAPVLPYLGVIALFLLGMRDLKQQEFFTAFVQAALGLGVLGGYLFRQWTKYKNRRILFLKTLADNLYFRNLDNNAGVFSHLIDAAEEEECKEAILAYYFLLTRGPRTEPDLDREIEQWFEARQGVRLDFEVDDALRKLEEMGIGRQQEGRWQVIGLAEALERLDRTWDDYFAYNQ